MKNKAYQQSKLKKELFLKREQGIRVLTWTLTPEKREIIERFGYRVEPFLFSIRTRTFSNIRALNSTLLKDLHFLKKRGKDYTVRKLTRGEMQILEENNIKYRPVKYRIYLR